MMAKDSSHRNRGDKAVYDADVVLSMGSRADEDSIAHELYRILRDCDELDVDVISRRASLHRV